VAMVPGSHTGTFLRHLLGDRLAVAPPRAARPRRSAVAR